MGADNRNKPLRHHLQKFLQFSTPAEYHADHAPFAKNIILAAWQLYSISPKDPAEKRKVLKTFLAKCLHMDFDFLGNPPTASQIKNVMKAKGYLNPIAADGISRTNAATTAKLLHEYKVVLLEQTAGRRKRESSTHFEHRKTDLQSKLTILRELLYQLNNNRPLAKKRAEAKAMDRIRTIVSAHNRAIHKRYAASADMTLHTLTQFVTSPYTAGIGSKLSNLWGGISRILHPKEWGQPELSATVYDIACILNAIGNREYLSKIIGYCLGKYAQDETGKALTKQQRLERFLAFLIKQFQIIEATPLTNMDDDSKQKVLLAQFKRLINRYSELAHLSIRLRLDNTDKKYKVEPRQDISYEKRRGRATKSLLKFLSDAVSIFVAIGQAVLTYYAIFKLIPILPTLLALVPPLIPFIPVIIPILAPFLLYGCTLATLYTNTTLFRADTWGATKQFVYKRDIYNGRKTALGKIGMGLALVGSLIVGSVTGFVIFCVAASSFHLVAFAAAPLTAVFVTLLSATTVLCFTANMYQATAGLISAVSAGFTSLKAKLVNNGWEAAEGFRGVMVVVYNTLKASFKHLAELWDSPVRVPDPLDPNETIADKTASPEAKHRQRIEWIFGGFVKAVFYSVGALLGLAATYALLGAFNAEITAGLKYWFGAPPLLTKMISWTMVYATCGIINTIFNLRGCKDIASYCSGLVTDYAITPVVNTAFRVVTDPISLAVDAKNSIEQRVRNAWKFCGDLVTDPQRTIAPTVNKAARVLVDIPLITLNAFANLALALQQFVTGDKAPGLTGKAIVASMAAFVNSAGVNLVQFNGVEAAKLPTEVTPVYQPEKDYDGFAPPPRTPKTPDITLEAAQALPPEERKKRLRDSTKPIYTSKNLAANFTFFAATADGSIRTGAKGKPLREPQPLQFNQGPYEVAQEVIASPCA